MEQNFIGMHACVQVDVSGAIEIPSMFLTALDKEPMGDAVWVYYDEPDDSEARGAWGGTILVKSEPVKQLAMCSITKDGKIEIPLRFWEKLGLGESRWVSLELESQYISPNAKQMEIAIRPQGEPDCKN